MMGLIMKNFPKFSFITLITFFCIAVIAYHSSPNEFKKTLRSFNQNFINSSIFFSFFGNKTNETSIFLPFFRNETKKISMPIKKFEKNLKNNTNCGFLIHNINNNTNCGFLTVSLMGGLGNVMSEIATLISLSLATNRKAVVPENENLKIFFDYFPNLINYVTINNSIIEKKSWETIEAKSGPCCHYDSTIFDRITNCEKNYFLHGFFVSWKYFENYSKIIKNAFAINSLITDKAKIRINEALKKFNFSRTNSIVIGIHNRRNDYVDKKNLEFGRISGSIDYFRASMIFYRRKHYFQDKNVIFFFVSDDFEFNFKNFGNFRDVFVFKPEIDPINDMCLLINCDELILSAGSTYSWWSGYLNGGPVVVSALVAKKNSNFSKQINRDFYLPTWFQF